jgi:hypothetical protein
LAHITSSVLTAGIRSLYSITIHIVTRDSPALGLTIRTVERKNVEETFAKCPHWSAHESELLLKGGWLQNELPPKSLLQNELPPKSLLQSEVLLKSRGNWDPCGM